MRRYQEGVTDADIERAFGDAEDECEIDDWELEVAIDEAIESRFLPGASDHTTPSRETPRALSGGGQSSYDTHAAHAPATLSSHDPGGAND